MPRKAPKEVVADEQIEVTDRDFIMARLAAGRSAAADAITAIDEAMGMFMDPESDKKGKERRALVETSLEALGVAARAVECAEENLDEYDPLEVEPWEDDEDVEEEDDEEIEEEDE